MMFINRALSPGNVRFTYALDAQSGLPPVPRAVDVIPIMHMETVLVFVLVASIATLLSCTPCVLRCTITAKPARD